MGAVIDSPYTFIWVLTGRGLGKTFGCLDKLREKSLEDPDQKFMYFRRLQAQIDVVAKPEFSPFKKVDRVRQYVTTARSISKNTFGFYDGDRLLGYAGALSTFVNLRGFDGSDISYILYEEAIPKISERSIPHEFEALMDAYETINRNREIDEGKPPVKLICIGNKRITGNSKISRIIVCTRNYILILLKHIKRITLLGISRQKLIVRRKSINLLRCSRRKNAPQHKHTHG